MKMRVSVIIGVVFVTILVLTLSGIASAEEKNVKIRTSKATGQIQGEVSAIDKHYIAIVYRRDLEKRAEYEILLPIDKHLKLVHLGSLAEIKVGDTVSVQFDEITDEYKSGENKKTRKGKTITFVRPAPKIPETETLNSGGGL